jgi:hypothetical protein
MKKVISFFNFKSIENNLGKIPVKKETAAKVISLLMSVALWGYISSTKMSEIKFKLPVEIRNLPASMTVSDMPDRSLIVVLEGKKEYMKNVGSKNIKLFVNLEKPVPGEPNEYPVQYIKYELPEGINVSLPKAEIKITAEKIIEKRVRVIPKISGSLKSGNIIGKITVTPEFVLVRGAKSTVKEINYIYTEDISIEDETGEIVKEVELAKENLKEVSVNETSIKVVIPIINYGDLYSLDVPVIIKNMNKNFKYMLENPTVKVYMKSSDKKGILPGDIEVSVDAGMIQYKTASGADRQKTTQDILAAVLIKKYGDSIQVVSVAPEKVTLKAEKK